MSIVFLQPHFLFLSWIWNNFSHIYNTEFLVWLTPLFLLCLYNICLIFTLIPFYIHLVLLKGILHLALLKGILPLHPPPNLHIHLFVLPQCFLILFFHNGNIYKSETCTCMAHIITPLHIWLWGLLFLWWDPFCHHKDQGTGMWTNTGKEELQTEQTYLCKIQGLLQTWEVMKQAQAMGRQDYRCPHLFIFSGTFPHWWTHHWLHWITLGLLHIRVSLVVEIVKTLPTVQETPVWSLGWEDALEKGMTTHSSVLAWRIPWTEEPGGLQSMELPMVGCDWVALTLPHLYFKHSLLSLFLFIDRLLKTFFLWLIHSLTLLSDSSQFF